MDIQKKHWENVFETRSETDFSWYQKIPETSIAFFEAANLPKDANIIDVGAGDSYFVDYLIANGYENVHILDLSAKAIERAQIRLGIDAQKVNWIVSDILDFKPAKQFAFWHDRAAFHFQTEQRSVARYVDLVSSSIIAGGSMVIGTFSENGPIKCSGLPITQYSVASLSALFSQNFERQKYLYEQHSTPFGTKQDFVFCSFVRK